VHLRAFERRFGIPVVETYGLSEAAATVTANPVPPGVHKAGSVGLPAGVALRICRLRDGEEEPERVGAREMVSAVPLQDVGHGETGEVCIAGPSVIAGYLGGGDRESFADGWFRTGDLGYLDDDGYLFLTGRLRDVIIRGGENIAPREVEETLLDAPDVEDAAVVGARDPIYGQRIVAYIVPGRTWTAARERQLRAFCAERLSTAKVPATFIAVQALPRTRSGKLARNMLREEALVQREAAG
jgi:acyl-CoA synthetase (AMP-forming)/AMP-acid ligase II